MSPGRPVLLDRNEEEKILQGFLKAQKAPASPKLNCHT